MLLVIDYAKYLSQWQQEMGYIIQQDCKENESSMQMGHTVNKQALKQKREQ